MRTKLGRRAFAIVVIGASLAGSGIYGYGRHGSSGGGGGGGVTADIYLAQAAAGAGTGLSCATAKAATFFNTAGNWGVGAGKIGPGKVVGLCGSITTELIAQGSGSAGSPITIVFEPASVGGTDAKLNPTVCTPDCIELDGQSWLTVDGNNVGQITSTDNGTALGHHTPSTGVSLDPCTNCEVKNLTIGPIYVISGANDPNICSVTGGACTLDNQSQKCIKLSGANNTIDNNTMHDASWCIDEVGTGSDGNERIYNNNIYNIDHGWAITGSGPFGHLYFHDNHIHDMGAWDACDAGANNNCHHDGIHCFFGPGSGTTFSDVYIYNNLWDGTLGGSATAWIYLESNGTSPCATATSKWYVFNNKFTSSDRVSTNAFIESPDSGTVLTRIYSYNNTFDGNENYGNCSAGPSPTCTIVSTSPDVCSGNDCIPTSCAQVVVDFENNVSGGCSRMVDIGSGTTDFNAYADSNGSNCWATGACTFATWQGTGHDTHSVYSAGGAVGSNAAGVGTNLTSLCVGDLVPLCSTRLGVARPTSGAWNAGSDS